MAYINNASLIKRELITRITALVLNDEISELDRIPVSMFPKGSQNPSRCCIYKSRAILKYRIMALLGYDVEDESDELKSLQEYYHEQKSQDGINERILTVIHEACTSCVKGNYTVSNLCKGCLASHCKMTCNKNAITIENGNALIDTSKCVNCGLCKDVCPYHAIIYVPVPCEESCPVKAISKNQEGVETIDSSRCIECGKCMMACPFGAISYKSQFLKVLEGISSKNNPVVAMVAPSALGQFKSSFSAIQESLLKFGFTDVIEVAQGAKVTISAESEELHERLANGDKFMTSSCCPSYVTFTEKHFPELNACVSLTKSPMHYTAEIVRAKHKDAICVFIGPCIAKQSEARKNPLVDFVLTFEEMGAMLVAAGVEINTVNGSDNQESDCEYRQFARAGGLSHILADKSGDMELKTMLVEGLDRKSISMLRSFVKKPEDANFIEVMSCEGGCLSGPGSIVQPSVASRLFERQWKLK